MVLLAVLACTPDPGNRPAGPADAPPDSGPDVDTADSDSGDSGSDTGPGTASTEPDLVFTVPAPIEILDDRVYCPGATVLLYERGVLTGDALSIPNPAGEALALVGDHDGDGFDDVLVTEEHDWVATIRSGDPAQTTAAPIATLDPRAWVDPYGGQRQMGSAVAGASSLVLRSQGSVDGGHGGFMLVYPKASGALDSPRTIIETRSDTDPPMVADMNGDGVDDVWIQGLSHGTTDVMGEAVDGMEVGQVSAFDVAMVTSAQTMLGVQDVTGDGAADLIYRPEAGALAVAEVSAGPYLEPDDAVSTITGVDDTPIGVYAIADLDGDGQPDLAAAPGDADDHSGFAVMFGVTPGVHDLATEAGWRLDDYGADDLLAADVDADGIGDVLYSGRSGEYELFLGGAERF